MLVLDVVALGCQCRTQLQKTRRNIDCATDVVWVEVFGGVFLLTPFLSILIYFGWDFFLSAWVTDEGTSVLIGIGNRWFIKSFVMIGFSLLLLSAISLIIRLAIRLWGPEDLIAETRVDAFTRASHSAFQ